MNQQHEGCDPQRDQRERVILLIEDNPNNAEVITLAITSETVYQVQWTSDAEAALPLISQRTPDLLLLDDRLPGMHGLELYDYLHTIPELRSVPALLISATDYGRDEIARHHLAFLAKPYALETLLKTIHALLEGGKV